MSDFDGKPLVLRDDIERELWGRVASSEWAAKMSTPLMRDVGIVDIADEMVVLMRVRQREVLYPQPLDAAVSERRCAVCLALSGAHHLELCPLGMQVKAAPRLTD